MGWGASHEIRPAAGLPSSWTLWGKRMAAFPAGRETLSEIQWASGPGRLSVLATGPVWEA
jgi:hypothetical protein